MHRRTSIRRSLVVPAVLAGLLLSSVPAVAGNPGHYSFLDTEQHPGITCYYGAADAASQDLIKLRVRGPRLYAYDKNSNVNSQKVGWRFVIEGAKAGVPPYKRYYKSSWLTATANDTTGHKFGARTWVQPLPTKNRQWKVHVEMRWYHPGAPSVVDATVKIWAQWYTSIYPPNGPTEYPMPCLPGM